MDRFFQGPWRQLRTYWTCKRSYRVALIDSSFWKRFYYVFLLTAAHRQKICNDTREKKNTPWTPNEEDKQNVPVLYVIYETQCFPTVSCMIRWTMETGKKHLWEWDGWNLRSERPLIRLQHQHLSFCIITCSINHTPEHILRTALLVLRYLSWNKPV